MGQLPVLLNKLVLEQSYTSITHYLYIAHGCFHTTMAGLSKTVTSFLKGIRLGGRARVFFTFVPPETVISSEINWSNELMCNFIIPGFSPSILNHF